MNLGISGQALGDVMDFEAIVDIGLKYGIRHYELWPCNVPGTGFGLSLIHIWIFICTFYRGREAGRADLFCAEQRRSALDGSE